MSCDTLTLSILTLFNFANHCLKILQTFCITSDLDWAPDEVVQYFLNILKEYDVLSTLFLTNRLGNQVKTEGHELAIHPNFTSLNFSSHIEEMLAICPQAQGSRSHSLFFSERLRTIYHKFNIRYQSNIMMYHQEGINPLPVSLTTTEYPLCWMDMFYLEMEEYPDFSPNIRFLKTDGLKIFDFHPVHVFLNTCSINHYNNAKEKYHHPTELSKHRNNSEPGIKDYLIKLLDFLKTEIITPKKLCQLNE